MRKIVFLFIFLLILYSCNSDEKSPFFVLSQDKIEFNWQNDFEEVLIQTNVPVVWDMSLPDWLSVSVLRKQGAEVTLKIEVKENESDNVRFYELVLGECSSLYIIQSVKEKLHFVGQKNLCVESFDTILNVPIDRNIDYDVLFLKDSIGWVTSNISVDTDFTDQYGGLKNMGKNGLHLNIAANYGEERYAEVVILNKEFDLSDTLIITQKGCVDDYYADGEIYLIQKYKESNANLIIMGDGFTNTDLAYNGRYKECMNKAAEYFFSIEPYKSYRDCFNVYVVVAESEEEGVGEKGFWGGNSINNKFGTVFGSGTEIMCDDELIFEYARKIKELPEGKPITVLVVLNSDKYAGTAYLYADGNSIALCPMSAEKSPNDFEGIVHHEAGGHAFGFLCDEYVYNRSEMPENRKNAIKEWQKLGYQMNLDFTNNLNEILWKDFIDLEKYDNVGAYEGGYEYQYGVWRSEENSCMNNNIPYYNVQSRWCIVSRIMKLSNLDFSVQDFIKWDNPIYPSLSRVVQSVNSFEPLAEPKWIMKK